MTLYLVRHAQAGSRQTWDGDDRLRPLTRSGRHQAAALVDWMGDCPITRVLSSPFRRCIQTAAPLAAALGLPIEEDEALAEEAFEPAIALVRALVGTDAALCTHGDIVPAVLDELAAHDGVRIGRSAHWAKGSVWVLEPADDKGRFASARYVPPTA